MLKPQPATARSNWLLQDDRDDAEDTDEDVNQPKTNEGKVNVGHGLQSLIGNLEEEEDKVSCLALAQVNCSSVCDRERSSTTLCERSPQPESNFTRKHLQNSSDIPRIFEDIFKRATWHHPAVC